MPTLSFCTLMLTGHNLWLLNIKSQFMNVTQCIDQYIKTGILSNAKQNCVYHLVDRLGFQSMT